MTAHEDFSRKQEVQGPSDRSFGLVFTAVFTVIGCWPLLHGRPIRLWALGTAVAFLVITAVCASLLRPLNRAWTGFSLLLNRITAPIITGLLFFLAVTPIALLFRATGKDPLRLRRDPGATSYWIPREPPGPAPETMANQF